MGEVLTVPVSSARVREPELLVVEDARVMVECVGVSLADVVANIVCEFHEMDCVALVGTELDLDKVSENVELFVRVCLLFVLVAVSLG